MMSENKCQRVFAPGDEDRISKLPDDLIGNILSRLITREAVATCILSKSWNDKWLTVSHIDINLHEYKIPEEMIPSVVNCLERLFCHGGNVTTIYFRSMFAYFSIDSSELMMASLISGLLKYKAEILHIDVADPRREIVVPGRLLSRETLRELVLEDSFFKVPTGNCFPLLETLRLRSLVISIGELETSNEIDNTTLKFTFPVLTTLEINHCAWPQGKSVEIYAPALQRLESVTNLEIVDNVVDYDIKIFGATGLLRFESSGEYLEDIMFIGSNCASVSIQIGPPCNGDWETVDDEIVRNLLGECSSTLENLELSFYVAEILTEALGESNHRFTLPIFNKLERLSLSYPESFEQDYFLYSTEALFNLLHAAPYLKSLSVILQDGNWDDYDYDEAESLPSCLLSTLEEIQLCISISEDDSFMSHVRLAKVLMQIGVKAELKVFHCEIQVEGSDYFNSDRFMEQIASFPRAPPHFTLCAIECDERGLLKLKNHRNIKNFRYCESAGWSCFVKLFGHDLICGSKLI